MRYINGHWSVSVIYIKFLFDILYSRIFSNDCDIRVHLYAGIGLVALDVRLGCLGGSLVPDSEPQKIIDAAKFALRNVAVLELKAPFWRYIPTPLWTRYVRNMNYFIEYVNLILINCYYFFFTLLSMFFFFLLQSMIISISEYV